MALEDLTGQKFLDALNSAYPALNDTKSEGDDHIRGIKNVLLNTFPSLTGAVNADQTEINRLVGLTEDLQTALDARQKTSATALADGYDLDDLQTPGRYYVDTPASSPYGGATFNFHVDVTTGFSGAILQVATQALSSSPSIFYRVYGTNGWSDWFRIVSENAATSKRSWTDVTLLNGWTHYQSTVYYVIQHKVGIDGMVRLKGVGAPGSWGTSMFTLPAASRPAKSMLFAAASSAGFAEVKITAAGAIIPSGSGTWVSLDGIQFEAQGQLDEIPLG